MFDSPEEIPETHSLLGLRLGNRYFEDIWDQEPYERIKELNAIHPMPTSDTVKSPNCLVISIPLS